MEEIKSCPFCGGEAKIEWYYKMPTTFKYWSIECLGCGVVLEEFDLKDEAIKAWNTRIDDSKEEK